MRLGDSSTSLHPNARRAEFRDVVDALRADLGGATGLRRVALIANLKRELLNNLRLLLEKLPSTGAVSPAYGWATHARKQLTGGWNDSSRIKGRHLMALSVFALTEAKTRGLATQFVDEAMVSGEFLVFDKSSDRYVVGPLQQAMISLKENVLRLERDEPRFTFDERWALVEKYRGYKDVDDLVEVENVELSKTLSLHDRHANIVALSAAILKGLDGANPVEPTLYPDTPLADVAMAIEGETPSDGDIERWVTLQAAKT